MSGEQEARLRVHANPAAALPNDALLQQAQERSKARGQERIAERDIALAVLTAAGFTINEGGASAANGAGSAQAGPAPGVSRVVGALEKYGRDLTRAAK